MIQTRPYKDRDIEFLNNKLRECQNLIQMRDWNIELWHGDTVPAQFRDEDNGTSVARCSYDPALLKAEIWISPTRCRNNHADPLFIMLHEIGHIWQEIHNEEVRCNQFASLMFEKLTKRRRDSK